MLNTLRISVFWALVPPKVVITALVILLGAVWSVLDWAMERIEP